MRVVRFPLRRVVPVAGALVALAVLPLAAQKVTSSRWALNEATRGFCIWYLADPAVAVELVDKGVVLGKAGAGEGLPDQLVRLIRDEHRFADWVPGALCIGHYQSVQVDESRPVVGKPTEPVTVITSFLAVEAPEGAVGARFDLLQLASDNRELRSAATDADINMDGAEIVAGKDRNGVEDQTALTLSGTKITWSGHPTGDPSVGTTRSMSFGYAGRRSTRWRGELAVTPGQTQLLVGGLRVEGKKPLAKALKSSPVRQVGPLEVGGAGTLSFQLLTAN